MLEDASNRLLLDAWRGGDQLAAGVLVRRYMARLTALARSRLSRKLARRIDSEDVVLSAWRSFFVGVGDGRVGVPDDDDLWPLLVTMTVRKLARQAARHSAERRSMQAEVDVGDDWREIVSRDPSPAEAALLTGEVENLLSRLEPTDREILTRRLQGEEQVAIAELVGCSERTVRRALQRIRKLYQQQSDQLTVPDPVPESPVVWPSRAAKLEDAEQLAESVVPTFAWQDVLLQQFAGQGAFGRVYRAKLRANDSTVAVKFLRKTLWRDAPAATLLMREVENVSRLSHAGIVSHLGWGRSDHGAVFSVMEWIDGADLNRWRVSAVPSFAEVIECGVAVGDALAAAHAAGVVHADLTPANVLRRSVGGFVLTDFGFSRVTGDAPVLDRFRAASDSAANVGNSDRIGIAGTPGFLAPEQLCDAFGAVSPRTDVFGLGGILYFLLTGVAPVTGRDLAEITAQTLSGAGLPDVGESVSGVPGELRSVVAKCLCKEPANRPEIADVLCQMRLIVDQPA